MKINTNLFIWAFVSACIIMPIVAYIDSYDKNSSYEKEVPKDTISIVQKVIVHDTIEVINRDSINLLLTINDSLRVENSKLAEENIINKYKLERIKSYSQIAKRGNNRKYFYGWVNRVLNN